MRKSLMILSRRWLFFALLLSSILLSSAASRAHAQIGTPNEVGVNEKLGAQVSLDTVLKDESGNDITLRQLIDRPTILTLNYFRCSGICTPLLNALADALNEMNLEPVKDFQVITVSFDPTDTPEMAHEKRINYLKEMKRPFPPAAWRFLTGPAQATKEVCDSVGFGYRAVDYGFVHPGVIMVLTPRGNVSRYLYGITVLPADLEMAIREAAAGQTRPSITRVLAFCYNFDPASRRYVLSITRMAGTAILILAAGFVIFLVRSRSGGRKEVR
jgi:protein SCO1/2